MNKVFFFIIIFVYIMHADDSQHYAYINLGYYESGLLYQLVTVIGILDQYENNKYYGVKVASERYDECCSCYQNYNWWECFFKKLDVGNTAGEFRCIPNYEKDVLSCCLYELNFGRVHELIKKYIEVQPNIREKIASYQREFFGDSFVIGVCYMNSSFAYAPVPKISYKKVYDMLLVRIAEKNNLKIFIYTNDERFYSFLKVKHPDIVFRYKQKEHFNTNIDKGEHELINCLLLSQTDFLIRTSSYFGLTISQFNPSVPVIELD